VDGDVSVETRLLDWLRKEVRPFLKQELAPYAGRGVLVARMVIASTAVMLITMIFRIPFGSHGAIYSFLVSRESARSAFATATTIVLAFSASAAFVLVGSMVSLGDPMLRLLWVVTALFVSFFVISASTDYLAATSFGVVVVVTLALWDQVISPELKVENTLWVLGQTATACLVTLGVELAFSALKPGDEVTVAMTDRLSAVAEFLTSAADGRPAAAAEQHLTQLGMLGTSRVRLFLRRSTYSPPQMEQMGAVVALVGRLVDIAVNIANVSVPSSNEDRAQMRDIAERIRTLRGDLLLGRVPQSAEGLAQRAASDRAPLVAELEKTVSLIPEVFTDPATHTPFALRPAGDGASRWFRADALSNPEHIKFALKGCLAATLCYALYTAVKWPAISTAVVTCMLTALTTIGASRQKQTLRIGGAIAGAFIAIGAQVFILPYVDSIGGFTVLFVAVTTGAVWIATSTPRLSYFGTQLALAFYIVHMQEFSMQTSLAVARDRLVGIALGLFVMWIVFDRLWGSSAAMAMRSELISTLRLLAQLVREPLATDTRVAVDRIRALRETINSGFDRVRAFADGVLFEFGPSRDADLAWRRRLRAWQPHMRLVFLTRVALLKYRLGLPGFQLPAPLAAAQAEFDRELAKRIDDIADRLEGKRAQSDDALERSLVRLEAVSRTHASDTRHDSRGSVHTFLPLSRRIEGLTASLDDEVGRGLEAIG
jgi:multidrug resistance protein MdtO